MTEAIKPTSLSISVPRAAEMFPVLTPAQVSRIAAHGRVRQVRQGEVLIRTEWLNGCLALDLKGFIKTGPVLTPDDLAAAHWPLTRAPHLLETSLPGVFAVRDVRGGSLKRVASTVGEGLIAVAFVHQVLHQ